MAVEPYRKQKKIDLMYYKSISTKSKIYSIIQLFTFDLINGITHIQRHLAR